MSASGLPARCDPARLKSTKSEINQVWNQPSLGLTPQQHAWLKAGGWRNLGETIRLEVAEHRERILVDELDAMTIDCDQAVGPNFVSMRFR